VARVDGWALEGHSRALSSLIAHAASEDSLEGCGRWSLRSGELRQWQQVRQEGTRGHTEEPSPKREGARCEGARGECSMHTAATAASCAAWQCMIAHTRYCDVIT